MKVSTLVIKIVFAICRFFKSFSLSPFGFSLFIRLLSINLWLRYTTKITFSSSNFYFLVFDYIKSVRHTSTTNTIGLFLIPLVTKKLNVQEEHSIQIFLPFLGLTKLVFIRKLMFTSFRPNKYFIFLPVLVK